MPIDPMPDESEYVREVKTNNSCNNCKFKTPFSMENNPTVGLNICMAEDFERHEEGYYIAPEVSSFNASECLLFKSKNRA